jgi:hypothetical protein
MLSRIFGRSSPAASAAAAAAAVHRPFLRRDAERLRWTGDGSFVLPADNPGIRVEPNFVSEEEERGIVREAAEMAQRYGYAYGGDTRIHTINSDTGAIESTLDNVVNNLRVTGRLERPDLIERGELDMPPWGYGDEFDQAAMPPRLSAVASRISTCGLFAVGAVRDLTINGRDHAFFQLDPHVDPASDGPDVFILSLLSSVVLTFTPPDELVPLAQRRREGHEVGLRSWTDRDIDVLVQPRTLLHFSGLARSAWKHAIRSGVQVGTGADAMTCDWWGKNDYLLKRSRERFSMVFAFGPPATAAGGGASS